MSTPFLDHLGLPEDADERAIKRAYARLLKQIDQAADPAGFQTLREAYEAALHWHHTRDAREAMARQQAGNDDSASAEADPAAGDAPQGARPSDPPAGTTGSTDTGETKDNGDTGHDAEAAPEPSPHAEVFELFLEFMGGLTAHGADKVAMLKALAACQDDARLQSLDARDVFEWFIARALAEGWKPGHEVLLVAAIEFFEWNNDRRRLLRFGRVGQTLDESIAERMVFDGQPLPVHARQKELIRLLRRPPRQGDADEARFYRDELELMVHHFPNWLWMIVPAERVQQWRQWAGGPAPQDGLSPQGAPQGPAAGRPVPAVQQAARAAPQPARKSSPLWFILGLLMVMGMLSNALKNIDKKPGPDVMATTPWRPPAQASGAMPYAVDPLEAVQTYGDISAKPKPKSNLLLGEGFPMGGTDDALPPAVRGRAAPRETSYDRASADTAPAMVRQPTPSQVTAISTGELPDVTLGSNPALQPAPLAVKGRPMAPAASAPATSPPPPASASAPFTWRDMPAGSSLPRAAWTDGQPPVPEPPKMDYSLQPSSAVIPVKPPENR